MSHVCGRSSSENHNLSNKLSKATDKKSCCVTTLTEDSKYFNHNQDKQHKTRRLKTRKERCQMRAGRKDTLKKKAHHHRCICQSRKDLTLFPNCSQSCHWPTMKNTQISSAVPVTQEPSIITDSRLIGHHGLFNHEVKSIDIERLLSEQSKLGQSGQKTNEEKTNTSNLCSTLCNRVLLSSDGLLGADADEGPPFKKEANAATKTHDDSQETEMMNFQFSNQGTNITPGQRLQQQLFSSCESFKSINQSKNSFQATKNKNTDNSMSAICDILQLKPFADRDNTKNLNKTINGDMISDLKQPDKNQDYQAQADCLISSPLRHFTSLSADNFEQQHKNQDPDHLLKATCAVATRLCECLQLPVPNRRNLLSETREVLLKSLQERHGPCLQANLQEVQRSLSCLLESAQATMEQELHMMEGDTSVKTPGSERFCWESSPQSHHNLQQITEMLETPVDSFVNLLDETCRPGFSPHLHMDFEPSGTSVSDLFAHSPILSQGDHVLRPELWEDNRSKTNKTKTNKSALIDSFQNNFMNHSRNLREQISEQQTHLSNVQPFFPYQDGLSADLQHFSKELNPSETDRFYCAPFFPSKSHRHPQSNHLQDFGQLSPFHPNFRSNPTDMMHYPPSHMLERSLAPPSSSLPSPEHWSFPPMRLY